MKRLLLYLLYLAQVSSLSSGLVFKRLYTLDASFADWPGVQIRIYQSMLKDTRCIYLKFLIHFFSQGFLFTYFSMAYKYTRLKLTYKNERYNYGEQ